VGGLESLGIANCQDMAVGVRISTNCPSSRIPCEALYQELRINIPSNQLFQSILNVLSARPITVYYYFLPIIPSSIENIVEQKRAPRPAIAA